MAAVELTFRAKRYGRETTKVVKVRYDDWDPVVANWLWPAMVELGRTTCLVSESLTRWDSLKFAIPQLGLTPGWATFASIPVAELEVDDVRDLFIDIDSSFHELWGVERGWLRSAAVRRLIKTYLFSARPDGRLSRIEYAFRALPRGKRVPRGPISDLISISTEGKMHPIGAMPHATPAELKILTREKMVNDFELISRACVQELAMYDSVCKALDEIFSASIDKDSELTALTKADAIRRKLRKSDSFTPLEQRALTAYYLRLDRSDAGQYESPGFVGSSVLEKEFAASLGIGGDNFVKCVRYNYFPHQTVYVAAIVLIQIATGWNVSSVMDLNTTGITASKNGASFILQSIKSKTRDDTPQILLEGYDNPAVIAINFAISRLAALKRRGWVDSDETALWLGPRKSSKGKQISNLSKGLKDLQKKHSLPAFTFEQVRVQKLSIVNLEKGPVVAAEVAGHSSMAVIGGYIDNMLSRRLNSAINLEFQKRWEEEVRNIAYGESVDKALVPTGDGSLCSNVNEPPIDEWLDAGVCDGTNCHSGAGCPNRVVLINADRVQEAVLTRRYYQNNWHRLFSQNASAFEFLHMPKIAFNLGLYEYIKRGPFRHLINE